MGGGKEGALDFFGGEEDGAGVVGEGRSEKEDCGEGRGASRAGFEAVDKRFEGSAVGVAGGSIRERRTEGFDGDGGTGSLVSMGSTERGVDADGGGDVSSTEGGFGVMAVFLDETALAMNSSAIEGRWSAVVVRGGEDMYGAMREMNGEGKTSCG